MFNAHSRSRIALIASLICGAIFFVATSHQKAAIRANYLFPGSISLDQHIVSYDTKVRSTLLLGGSATAGNRIPFRTTIADFLNEKSQEREQVYNLATFQSNVVDSLIIFHLAFRPGIRKVILGIEPTMFPLEFGDEWQAHHADLVYPYFPAALNHDIRGYLSKKFYLPRWLLQSNTATPPMLEACWNFVYHLAVHLYGHTYSQDLFGRGSGNEIWHILEDDYPMREMLAALKKSTEEKGATLYVYSHPIFRPEVVFSGAGQFERYQEKLRRTLAELSIPYLDLSFALPNTSEYFIDYVHLQPAGNRVVAEQLSKAFMGEDKP